MAKRKQNCKNCPEIRRCAECKDNYGKPYCKTMQGRLSLSKWTLFIICFVAFLGVLGPFTAECILPFFFPKEELETLSHWNTYVGIILGSVATILSIVSLAMAFHNMDEAYAQQRTSSEQYSNMMQAIKQSEINEKKLEVSQSDTQENYNLKNMDNSTDEIAK